MKKLRDHQLMSLLPTRPFTSHEAQVWFEHKNRKTTRARLMDLISQGLLNKLADGSYVKS